MNSRNSIQPETSSDKRGSWLDLMVLAILLAFPSTGFIQKYAGLAGVAVYLATVIVVLFVVAKTSDFFATWIRSHFRILSVCLVAGLSVGFVVLHPMEDGRGLGKSSDRDEGLELAATRMAEGRTPYYPSDRFAGPLSVLPGSVILAAPFVALGNPGYQNIFWLAVFLVILSRMFEDKALALCLVAVPLALSPAGLYEFVSGGDMLANGIFVAVFLLLALESLSNREAPWWRGFAACVLLGIGLASRSNFLILMPLFGALLWRRAGLPRAIAGSGLVVLVAAAITVPFYLNDPAGFTPLLAKQKLAIVDHALPWASKAMIGMTIVTAIVGAVALLLQEHTALNRSFFRWCTWVTLCPMICAVLSFSLINHGLDFGFMRDRFGLMFVFFALLGWGGTWFQAARDIPSGNPADEIPQS